jgi:hypothetical protein
MHGMNNIKYFKDLNLVLKLLSIEILSLSAPEEFRRHFNFCFAVMRSVSLLNVLVKKK